MGLLALVESLVLVRFLRSADDDLAPTQGRVGCVRCLIVTRLIAASAAPVIIESTVSALAGARAHWRNTRLTANHRQDRLTVS
jgi:hypothetical protein